MLKLPRISGKKLVSILNDFDFHVIRIKGSHYFLRHEDGRSTVVPVHSNEDLGPGIISKILKDCELQNKDLFK